MIIVDDKRLLAEKVLILYVVESVVMMDTLGPLVIIELRPEVSF